MASTFAASASTNLPSTRSEDWKPTWPLAAYYAFRVFHAGMATPVPVANGGTGASTTKAALNNLGIFYSATLPSTGTDGQICLVPV